MSTPDPFDTAELRAATLQSWARSPTRLREDIATETDLARGGYRDRVLTELAQNAADAAARSEVRGELTVRLVGTELHVANTGAPLDRGGVQALAALRASGKSGGVGRFGVGFTAVLAVSEEPRVLSTSGSVLFSASRTREELGREEVPVLRLVWPSAQTPVAGASTEVVLPLRAGIDGAVLLQECADLVPELLLALPALHSISVGDAVVEREERTLDSGLLEVRIGAQRWWSTRGREVHWLARLDGAGELQPLGADVLRAPTRTDEELSLPALLIADVPLQPDRRRVLPGASLHSAAQAYPDLVSSVPRAQRTRLVPLPGFPHSAVDAELREGMVQALREALWLPAACGKDVAPQAAQGLDVANPELVGMLAEVLPGLLSAELSGPAHSSALVALGVPRLGLSAVADALSGVQRDPHWWYQLYAALDSLVADRHSGEELAALPVPLVDGRTVLGPRSTVLAEAALSVPGVRVVHPEAAHPLLARLGAETAGASELLEHESLRTAVRESDPDDVAAAAQLSAAVFALVDAAGVRLGEHAWLGELLLLDTDGELRAADELLLPDAPLRSVLSADSPFATVAPAVVAEHGERLLRAVGVGWGFTVLVDDEATGPEHALDAEEQWWAVTAREPTRVVAVRDLDLVDSGKWPQALDLLCAEPETLAAVRIPDGYTAWWLRRYARLNGVALGLWRHHEDNTFAGLLDAAPVPGLPPEVLAGASVDSVALAALLLARLADPTRTPSVATVVRTHAALAAAVDAQVVSVDALELPERVRTLYGVVDPASAVVLDEPWFAEVLADDRVVLGALGSAASSLAELLDLPLASEQCVAQVVSDGEPQLWAELAEAVLACAGGGTTVPDGSVWVHPTLTVRLDGHDRTVDWWVDVGVLHAQRRGLAEAVRYRRRVS